MRFVPVFVLAALFLSSFTSSNVFGAPIPGLMDLFRQQMVPGGILTVTKQLIDDLHTDPILCFEGNPKDIYNKYSLDNRNSESKLKRSFFHYTESTLVAAIEQKVCINEERYRDEVDCLEYGDQIVEYLVPSCQSRAQDILFGSSLNNQKLKSSGWIRGAAQQKNIFPNLEIELFNSGRNKLHIVYRLTSVGHTTTSSPSGISNSFIIDGTIHQKLRTGMNVSPDSNRQCTLKLETGPATKGIETVAVHCNDADFKLPVSIFSGNYSPSDTRTLIPRRSYELMDGTKKIISRGESLAEALKKLLRAHSPIVSGSREQFLSDLDFLSSQGTEPIISFYENSYPNERSYLINFDPRAASLIITYKGKCTKYVQEQPAYPGDDGLVCGEFETGLIRKIQF